MKPLLWVRNWLSVSLLNLNAVLWAEVIFLALLYNIKRSWDLERLKYQHKLFKVVQSEESQSCTASIFLSHLQKIITESTLHDCSIDSKPCVLLPLPKASQIPLGVPSASFILCLIVCAISQLVKVNMYLMRF